MLKCSPYQQPSRGKVDAPWLAVCREKTLAEALGIHLPFAAPMACPERCHLEVSAGTSLLNATIDTR
jgi:hypothetical protein